MHVKRMMLIMTAGAVVWCGTVRAYDTGGAFGMGLRVIGSPVVLTSTMKIGLTDRFTLEPSIGFYETKVKYEDEYYDYVYDPSLGYYVDVWREETRTYIDNIAVMTLLGDFKPVLRERSNLVLRGGAAYSLAQSIRKYDGNPHRDDSADGGRWSLALLGGLGVEHFFTDHFSAYAGWLAGFVLLEDEDYEDYYQSMKGFGNQLLDFSLVWYL